LLYASTFTGSKCSWSSLPQDVANLKHAENFGKWAYATPIVTILLTIFVLSGAFFMHDANKTNVSGSAVARKWTDTQVTIEWKYHRDNLRTSWKQWFEYPIKKLEVLDFYAIERVAMDRSMICYLPIDVQNRIRAMEKSLLSFLNTYAENGVNKDPNALSKDMQILIKELSAADPVTNKDDTVDLTRLEAIVKSDYGEMKKMYAEAVEFFIYYKSNIPMPPPQPEPVPDKKLHELQQAKWRGAVATYKKTKLQAEEKIVDYAAKKKDLLDVLEALKKRTKTLEKAPKKDLKLKTALSLIVTEFAEYIGQIEFPDRRKGSNIITSCGPKTFLRKCLLACSLAQLGLAWLWFDLV